MMHPLFPRWVDPGERGRRQHRGVPGSIAAFPAAMPPSGCPSPLRYYEPRASNQRSASIAAMQPEPAAVIAWR